MLNYRKSITVTGESVVGGANVAYMNATISDNGEININRSIQNKELFETNKDAITADFTEFDEYAYSLVSESAKEENSTVDETGAFDTEETLEPTDATDTTEDTKTK